LDDSLASRVPTFWGISALEQLQGLPPYEAATTRGSLTTWFSETCANGVPFLEMEDPERQSLHAAITRGAGMRFLPLYDMFNHDNGKLNALTKGDEFGDSIVAVVDIKAGSGIFTSYKGSGATSSEIFQKYGFVEGYPQLWAWKDPVSLREGSFLCLSDDDGGVIINPTESMTADAGTVIGLIDTLLAGAGTHNSNVSMEELEQFSNHFNGCLQSLPTTLAQDTDILNT